MGFGRCCMPCCWRFGFLHPAMSAETENTNPDPELTQNKATIPPGGWVGWVVCFTSCRLELQVAELREELRARGLVVSGRKAELVQRLEAGGRGEGERGGEEWRGVERGGEG